MLARIVLFECVNRGNFWYRYAKLETACKQSAVQLFCSRVRT